MADVIAFPAGGYRYVPGVFQYSASVAAESGFEIERARFARPLPLLDGFAALERHLAALGRATTAFCACELRSSAPFTESGFTKFNRGYVTTLERWGIYREGRNPVACSNVCPEVAAPGVPSLYAFSYTVPARPGGRGTFVVAGSGEAPEGQRSYAERAIRRGDRSTEGLRKKARWVLAEMERRMAALGVDWASATATQLYTVYDILHSAPRNS